MMRCATLMPSPMMFICALRSFTRRTGPRLTPRRTGASPAMSRTDMAENNASSGSPMKVTAAPSPVSRMMRSRCGTGSSASVSTRLNTCFSCSCSATGFFEYSTMSRNRTLHTSVRLELSITFYRPIAARGPRCASFYAHAGLCSGIGGNEKNARFVSRGGEDHAFRDAELHLARRQVRHHYREPAFQLFRRIGGFDAGEHGARAVADVEGELEQLVRPFHRLRPCYAGYPQLELAELVDRNFLVHGKLLGGVLLRLGVPLRRGRLGDRLNVEQLVELLFVDPGQKVAVLLDAVPGGEGGAGVLPLEGRSG